LTLSATLILPFMYAEPAKSDSGTVQSEVDNPDFSLDDIGSQTPLYWSALPHGLSPVVISQDPTNSANRALKLTTISSATWVGATTLVPIVENMTYTLSADVYRDPGTAQPQIYLQFLDSSGATVSSTTAYGSQVGIWKNLSVSAKAPPSAVNARIWAYLGGNNTGAGYFDNFLLRESYATRYVAPVAAGTGDALSPANPAKFNDTLFWANVKSQLNTRSVKVIFAEGHYLVNSRSDSLTLWYFQNTSNLLILEGEHPMGTIFTKDNAAEDTMPPNNSSNALVNLSYMENVILRHLHWEDSGTNMRQMTSSSLRISSSSNKDNPNQARNILIEGCSFVGLNRNVNGIQIFNRNTNHVTIKNCEFTRLGVDSSAQMICCAESPHALQVLDSYFQDCTGPYIRFRGGCQDGCHQGLVDGNVFVSTQAYCNWPFIEQAALNWNGTMDLMGTGFTFTNNQFAYFVPTGNLVYQRSAAIWFHAQGFSPTDSAGKVWGYELTAPDASILHSTAISEKHTLIKDHYDIDFGVNTFISGNIRTGFHAFNVLLSSIPAYGSTDHGGAGDYEISDVSGL